VKATTIAKTEMKSKARPKVKLGCCDFTNSLCANLDEVKFDKNESIDAEEVNNATAFANMKTVNHALLLSPGTVNHGLVLSPGTVRAAANATVATSAATSMPDSDIPLPASLISSDNFLCSS